MKYLTKYKILSLFLFLIFIGNILSVNGATVFLTLDFEFEDYTKLEQGPAEKKTLQGLKTELTNKLRKRGHDAKVVKTEDWESVNQSVGYLFNRPKNAEQIGAKYNADYVIIGKISKPSNLFVYLIVEILDVKRKIVVANYQLELKGQWVSFTDRGLEQLAKKITKKFDTAL